MAAFVEISAGSYRGQEVRGVTAPLVKPVTQGKKGFFVTVLGTEISGENRPLRITVPGPDTIRYLDKDGNEVVLNEFFEGLDEVVPSPSPSKPAVVETDAQVIERMRKRFALVEQMADAVAQSMIRGLVISGPPGVGKSYSVAKVLDAHSTVSSLTGSGEAHQTISGNMSAVGLYQALYANSAENNILVLDDCDAVLFDDVCLNLLKTCLDNNRERKVSWMLESHVLRKEGIPKSFEFKGGIVFITNLKFDQVQSKKLQPHLEAVLSRCHYVDLEMDSTRDKLLRIRQLVQDGMLDSYEFRNNEENDILEFVEANTATLREISLRMVTKLADLCKVDRTAWQDIARVTCVKKNRYK